MVLTVEPGCYFIPAVLKPALEVRIWQFLLICLVSTLLSLHHMLQNPETAKFFVKEKIDRFMAFGGIRLEDDIVRNLFICNACSSPLTSHHSGHYPGWYGKFYHLSSGGGGCGGCDGRCTMAAQVGAGVVCPNQLASITQLQAQALIRSFQLSTSNKAGLRIDWSK